MPPTVLALTALALTAVALTAVALTAVALTALAPPRLQDPPAQLASVVRELAPVSPTARAGMSDAVADLAIFTLRSRGLSRVSPPNRYGRDVTSSDTVPK